MLGKRLKEFSVSASLATSNPCHLYCVPYSLPVSISDALSWPVAACGHCSAQPQPSLVRGLLTFVL